MTRRRANNTGTITKRNDGKRKNRYYIYKNGYDLDGNRIRIFVGSFPTYAKAQDFAEKYNQGITELVTPKEADYSVTVADVWKAFRHGRKTISRNTAKAYDGVWDNYIRPRIGHTPIAEVKTRHMQDVINRCKYPSAQHHIRSVFRNLFKVAIANDWAEKDYTVALDNERPQKVRPHKVFTTKEIQSLWKKKEKDTIKIILILCYTGMRKGELEKVLLKDVYPDEQYLIGGMKTDAGRNRRIPLPDCILPFIRYFYDISKQSGFPYLLQPDKKRSLPRLFETLNIGLMFKREMPEHTPHDTRHTFISLCSNYGVPEDITKKIVGHASANITETVYTHKSDQQLLEWVNTLPYGPDMYISPEEKSGCQVVATK